MVSLGCSNNGRTDIPEAPTAVTTPSTTPNGRSVEQSCATSPDFVLEVNNLDATAPRITIHSDGTTADAILRDNLIVYPSSDFVPAECMNLLPKKLWEHTLTTFDSASSTFTLVSDGPDDHEKFTLEFQLDLKTNKLFPSVIEAEIPISDASLLSYTLAFQETFPEFDFGSISLRGKQPTKTRPSPTRAPITITS